MVEKIIMKSEAKRVERFVFTKVYFSDGEAKWLESYEWLEEDEDGNPKWTVMHETRYMSTLDMYDFAGKLESVGFERTEEGVAE